MATSGDRWVEFGKWLGPFISNCIQSVCIFVLIAAIIGADLALGPQFMNAYGDTNLQSLGMPFALVVPFLPWIFSITTTSYQYMLGALIKQGGSWHNSTLKFKMARISGIVIALADTGGDVAGFTTVRYGAEQGLKVVPDNAPAGWYLCAALIVIVCGGQEFFLEKLLDWRGKDASKKVQRRVPGGRAIEGVIWLAGQAFGFLRFLGHTGGSPAVLALDVSLTFYFLETQVGSMDGAAGFFSGTFFLGLAIGLTTLQSLGYRYLENNNIKWRKEWWAWIVVAATLFDVATDLGGFTTLMYGQEQGSGIIPHPMSLAYGLMAIAIVGLCGFYEIISDEVRTVFVPFPKAKAKADAKRAARLAKKAAKGKPGMPGMPPGMQPPMGRPGGMPGMPPFGAGAPTPGAGPSFGGGSMPSPPFGPPGGAGMPPFPPGGGQPPQGSGGSTPPPPPPSGWAGR